MLRATAGSRLFIGPPTTAAGLYRHASPRAARIGIAWVEIGRMEGLGSLGAEWSTEHFRWQGGPALGEHQKMGRRGGGMEIAMGLDDADAGQLALVAAERSPESFAFLLRFGMGEDDPFRLWVAVVTRVFEDYGQGGSVMTRSAEMLVNSEPWRG